MAPRGSDGWIFPWLICERQRVHCWRWRWVTVVQRSRPSQPIESRILRTALSTLFLCGFCVRAIPVLLGVRAIPVFLGVRVIPVLRCVKVILVLRFLHYFTVVSTDVALGSEGHFPRF